MHKLPLRRRRLLTRRDGRIPIAKGPIDTRDDEYARRLYQSTWWKRLLNVQAPYQWNLRRLKPGRTLDLGCGIGRNLAALGASGVGVDHNASSVEMARNRGLVAFTPEEFRTSHYNASGTYDSLLVSHVLEHLTKDDARSLIAEYIDLVRPGGLMILITPQEAGFKRDASHLTFTDFAALDALCETVHARIERQFSFPLPRRAGRFFFYNEFVVVARLQEKSAPEFGSIGRSRPQT